MKKPAKKLDTARQDRQGAAIQPTSNDQLTQVTGGGYGDSRYPTRYA